MSVRPGPGAPTFRTHSKSPAIQERIYIMHKLSIRFIIPVLVILAIATAIALAPMIADATELATWYTV